MIRIVQVTTNDVPALLPMIMEYWNFEAIPPKEPQRIAAELKRLLSAADLGAAWLATIEAVPVGYLLAAYVFSLEHLGLTAEIDELFVLPSQRGNGIGARLLRTAETEFVRIGCKYITLQLARDNDIARTFYHREGYVDRSRYELLDKALSSQIEDNNG